MKRHDPLRLGPLSEGPLRRGPRWPVAFARAPGFAALAFAALVLMVLALAAGTAQAAGEDAQLVSAVNSAMGDDYPGNLGSAKQKLQAALDRCKSKCGGAAKAQALISMGMVLSQLGKDEEAKSSFIAALQADPKAKLPALFVATPNIKSQWAEAVAKAAPPPPPPPPVAAEPEPGVDASVEPGPVAGAARAPAGWNSKEAFDLASAALNALTKSSNFQECIDKNKESLKLEEKPRTRMVLSACERKAGKYIDALQDAQKALQSGITKRDKAVIDVARPEVEKLIRSMPHVTFVAPAGAGDLEVKFDDRVVPNSALTKKFSIDPGKHSVHAGGTLNGVGGDYDEEFEVKESELLTIRIVLKPRPTNITRGQLDCLLKAKNDEEIKKCVEKTGKSVVIKAGMDVSGYADTNHVYVFSPEIHGAVISPTSGWNVGGSYTLDVVTAASPDIVSEASRRYKEQRHAATLNGGYKPGLYGASAQTNVSSEPDYLSLGAGLAVTGDFRDKLVTPRLALNYSHDKIGRGPDNFIHNLDSWLVEGGVTLVLSADSVINLSGTFTTERGDQSKPYRYVPIFDPDTAKQVPAGATIDLVNRFRTNVRPLEQLPTERDRYAVGARYLHRFTGATLRLEQRLYADTWGTKASTTDARYLLDLSRHFRVWPHLRVHGQSGTYFHRLAYSGVVDDTGGLTLPTYRSGDRELSPMATVTAGGGTRIGLGAPEAPTQFGITISGDLMYSRFFNVLYVTTRTAVYGTIGFDVEFE